MRIALCLLVMTLAGAAAAGPGDHGVVKFDQLKGAPPPGVKASGTLDKGYYFGDKNGLNYVLFSSKQIKGDPAKSSSGIAAKYIFVDHWVVPAGGKPRLVRTVKELLEQCEGDMDLQFHDNAFGVSDVDGNGIAEITFAYETACRSDVSAATYKLLLLENGAKYILRGTTRIDTHGDGADGGKYTPDPVEKKWPKGFFDYATMLWDMSADDLETPPGSSGGAANPCGN